MRHIVIDTETTGLDSTKDKLVEVGAVELIDYAPQRTFHAYYNPGIPVPPDAVAVHGLTNEFLAAHPPFTPEPLLEFLAESPIIAHNAAFDICFLSAVLGPLPNQIIDTLALARSKHPGAPASLDALCKRYGVSTARRTKHGALLDAHLLAEVYIELVGRQSALELTLMSPVAVCNTRALVRPRLLQPRLTAAEIAAHAAMMDAIAARVI